jgi:hypothetical protein
MTGVGVAQRYEKDCRKYKGKRHTLAARSRANHFSDLNGLAPEGGYSSRQHMCRWSRDSGFHPACYCHLSPVSEDRGQST